MLERFWRKLHTDRRGAALVFTMIVTAVLMILATAILSITGTDSRMVLAREEKKAAQYMAESAFELFRQQIMQDGAVNPTGEFTDWIPFDNSSGLDGRYRLKVTGPDEEKPNRYTVAIEVQKNTRDGEPVVKDLEVVFEYTPGSTSDGEPGSDGDDDGGIPYIPPEPPPADPQYMETTVLDYALVSGGNLPLIGDIMVDGPIFANSSITLNCTEIKRGPVRAVGDISGESYPRISIEPDQPLPLTMPVVDWVYIEEKSLQQEQEQRENNPGAYDEKVKLRSESVYDDGVRKEYDISGPQLNGGDIVYVDGNAHITGEISASALIAASGDIYIEGDYSFPDAEHAAVGLIAGDNIRITGVAGNRDDMSIEGPKIRGLLIAGKDVITVGEASIDGCLIAGSQLQPDEKRLEITYDSGLREETGNPVSEVLEIYGTPIIKNYDQLNISYPVASTPWTGTGNNDNPSDIHDIVETSPEFRIIGWKELN